MVLIAEIMIHNKLVNYSKSKQNTRKCQSKVSIRRKPQSADKNVYMIIEQANAALKVQMYKVHGNITAVRCKFIKDGKVTISFKEPEHDIFIHVTDMRFKTHLQQFLRSLKHSMDTGTTIESAEFLKRSGRPNNETSLDSSKPTDKLIAVEELEKMNRKTVLEENFNLDNIHSFLYDLTIYSCSYRKFIQKFKCLINLRSLTLNNCGLDNVPDYITSLEHLTEVNLDLNRITEVTAVSQAKFTKNLINLSFASNTNLQYLPEDFHQLSSLVRLNLDKTGLLCLPEKIGYLVKLRVLYLSQTKLKILPNSFQRLRLDELNLFQINFTDSGEKKFYKENFQPSLLELTCQSVILNQIPYNEELVGVDMCMRLSSYQLCECGKPVFRPYAIFPKFVQIEAWVRSQYTEPGVIDGTLKKKIPIQSFYCHYKCTKFLRKPNVS